MPQVFTDAFWLSHVKQQQHLAIPQRGLVYHCVFSNIFSRNYPSLLSFIDVFYLVNWHVDHSVGKAAYRLSLLIHRLFFIHGSGSVWVPQPVLSQTWLNVTPQEANSTLTLQRPFNALKCYLRFFRKTRSNLLRLPRGFRGPSSPCFWRSQGVLNSRFNYLQFSAFLGTGSL